jgi:hypothetical protein
MPAGVASTREGACFPVDEYALVPAEEMDVLRGVVAYRSQVVTLEDVEHLEDHCPLAVRREFSGGDCCFGPFF